MIGRSVGAAAAFLTRAPGLARFEFDAVDLVRGAVVFPLVGAGVGALVGGVVVGLSEAGLPVLLAATVAVGVEVVVTGGLHLDGLADSADGLAGRTPERALQIMRDSAAGVYGIAAVVLDLLVKVVAVGSLPPGRVVPVLVAAYAVARSAPLLLAAALPYAGVAGTGGAFVAGVGWGRAVVAVGVAVLIAVLAVGGWSLVLLAALGVTALAVGWAARRRLGGVTGDVLGAAIELSLLAGLVSAPTWAG